MEVCAVHGRSVVWLSPEKLRLCVKIKTPKVLFLRQPMYFSDLGKAYFPVLSNHFFIK